MVVHIVAHIRPVKNGVLVQAESMGLAGLGQDEAEGVEALAGAVAAWCQGLRRAGQLEGGLERCGLVWESDGDEGIVVSVDTNGVRA